MRSSTTGRTRHAPATEVLSRAMRALLLVVALGCGSASPAPIAPSAPPPAAPCPPAAAPAAAMLDEAAVKAKSHAFLEAIDRTDVAAATAELSPSFLRVDPARYYDTKWLVASLASRKGATRTRTYKDERIELAPNLAVFMGESIEHVPATATHPAAEIDRWHTLTWAYDGSAWKLAQWTSRDGGIDASASSGTRRCAARSDSRSRSTTSSRSGRRARSQAPRSTCRAATVATRCGSRPRAGR